MFVRTIPYPIWTWIQAKQRTISLVFIGIMIFFSMYSLFFIILKKSGIESLQSWIESESISLQQGNFLSSVTKTQKILLKSDVVKGIALFNIQHNPPEMPVGFGLTPQIEIISEVNKIQVVQSGFLTFSLFFRFRDYPNMMIGFFVYSKSLSIFFCIFSLLLFDEIAIYSYDSFICQVKRVLHLIFS